MRRLGIVSLCVALGGCAIQRAQIAHDARAQMVGLSKEQVTCMGPPASKAAPNGWSPNGWRTMRLCRHNNNAVPKPSAGL
jgi:hypothetical protein